MNSTLYKKKSPLLLFLIPAFTFLVVFLFYPFVMNIINSFMKIEALGAAPKGLNDPWYTNYIAIFKDANMGIAMRNTLLMMAATVIIQVGIALLLSLLVDNIGKGSQFFRTVYFFPIVISATALGLLFNIIFLYDKGMVNQFISLWSSGALIDWKDKAHAFVTLLIPVMWQYVGFYFVILITGLNNIDGELYAAAEIDGASGLQRVRYITLPLLKPVIATCVVLAITGSLKVFDMPWIMFPKGMPTNATWLTGTYMYYQTFQVKNVDYGSTIAIAIVILGVATSAIVNRITREKK